jgi:hypothetical protein
MLQEVESAPVDAAPEQFTERARFTSIVGGGGQAGA